MTNSNSDPNTDPTSTTINVTAAALKCTTGLIRGADRATHQQDPSAPKLSETCGNLSAIVPDLEEFTNDLQPHPEEEGGSEADLELAVHILSYVNELTDHVCTTHSPTHGTALEQVKTEPGYIALVDQYLEALKAFANEYHEAFVALTNTHTNTNPPHMYN